MKKLHYKHNLNSINMIRTSTARDEYSVTHVLSMSAARFHAKIGRSGESRNFC